MKSPVVHLTAQDTVARAAEVMRDEDVGFLAIVDSAKQVIGVITDRDLVVRLLAEHRPAETALSEVMTDEVLACAPDDDLRTAANRMARMRRARIVVLEDDGTLAGVVSLSDVVEHLEAASATWTVREVTQRAAPRVMGATGRASLPA